MKINSEKLWEYINDLSINNQRAKFKVYYDDNYLTEIYWDGDNFNWEAGKFTSGAFFDPLYDFEIIEEEQDIEEIKGIHIDFSCISDFNTRETLKKQGQEILKCKHKINEIIKEINKLKNK